MFFSSLGASFVSKYAPKHILSIMMTVWIVATFGAAKGYSYLYKLVAELPIVNVALGIGGVCVVAPFLISKYIFIYKD